MKVSCFGLFALTTPILAGTCTKDPLGGKGYYCGQVVNKSGRQLRYTTDPSLSSSRPNKCKFWNWVGHDEPINCTQKYLANGKTAGSGYVTTPGVDVDGFTFADVEYDYDGQRITRGVWIKISSNGLK
ncbi:hypothetical protein P171DRAFT_516806 [Karstenula rhodostoma CBS 690.94]|uniref:Uncharacterized protein n=1 Tax=Karstenula rhodostoma CBS 690.94 TaxID=1392251 RepID=A0A9P4PVA0_9PLEO|nr:hypothetical protein P171DRAFT_516806 [Karstenula rhodostoma CBS 690.94]